MLQDFKNRLNENGAIYIRFKVHPGTPKTEITEIMEDKTVKINVASPPIGGKANGELVRFIAKEFEVPLSAVKIISGAGGRIKLVKIKL
jgi:uncharacterized protein (TIGR00251 family)